MPNAAGTIPPMVLRARDRRRAGMRRSVPSVAVAVFWIESECSAVIACAAMSDDRCHAGAGSRRAASAASAPTEGRGRRAQGGKVVAATASPSARRRAAASVYGMEPAR